MGFLDLGCRNASIRVLVSLGFTARCHLYGNKIPIPQLLEGRVGSRVLERGAIGLVFHNSSQAKSNTIEANAPTQRTRPYGNETSLICFPCARQWDDRFRAGSKKSVMTRTYHARHASPMWQGDRRGSCSRDLMMEVDAASGKRVAKAPKGSTLTTATTNNQHQQA
jgi:hypothetical protein